MNDRALSTLLLILFSLTVAAAGPFPEPVFDNASEEVTESGYIKLSWRWVDPEADPARYEFELQQAENEHFDDAILVYRGQDFASFLSGLKNGGYYYRVRAVFDEGQTEGKWSEPVFVKVEHHSLKLTFTLFGIGALVFLLTVGVVVQGTRKVRQNP